MQGTENTITMLGERMEVFVGAGCLAGYDCHLTPQLPAIISSLCRTLSKRQVARAFMHHVRIGETVALVDRKMGCSFRLKMEAHSVCVLAIHSTTAPPQNAAKVYYFINDLLLQRHDNRMAVAA